MTTVTAGPRGQESPVVTSAIKTEALRKTYKSSRGDVAAVRGIDLDVPQGEFFGLLGPNGAGKPNLGNWQFFCLNAKTPSQPHG